MNFYLDVGVNNFSTKNLASLADDDGWTTVESASEKKNRTTKKRPSTATDSGPINHKY